MVQWDRYPQSGHHSHSQFWGPLGKERLKSSKGVKEDSRWGVTSPFSSAQKSSFSAVVFSRLISPLFSIEEEDYVGFFPHLQVHSGLTLLVLRELSEQSCFLFPDPSVISYCTVKNSHQGSEILFYIYITIYGIWLEGRYCLPSMSSPTLVF